MKTGMVLSRRMLARALLAAFAKLDPRIEWKNPVMFIVWIGSALCTLIAVVEWVQGHPPSSFTVQVIAWLWLTLLFANFAESIAEIQGRARADSLRTMRKSVLAHRLDLKAHPVDVPSGELRSGDVVLCAAGDMIPGDGEVIEGIASVDESAITGESAPVIRESGGDRSGVTGGTRIISDRILVRISSDPGNSFIDRMIAMVENATRQKTPGEIALSILLASLSLIFVLSVATLWPFSQFIANQSKAANPLTVLSLAALLVCLIPTTIGGLLSAIGISGVSRLMRKNVMALSGRAIEAAGDADTLLLDKTGTITLGNRMATEFVVAEGASELELASQSLVASLADETPEGTSIVLLARKVLGAPKSAEMEATQDSSTFVPFSARTRMSGIDRFDAEGRPDPTRSVRKGTLDSIREFVETEGGAFPEDVRRAGERIARSGATPLAVAFGSRVLGVIRLKDVVKEGIKERFADLRKMGIKTIMITGDNRLTAAAIAAEAGVSDFIAEAKPETKLEAIKRERAEGHIVGMIGDGTNDAPALAQADIGIAMASGTQTAREAGNMVDFDNDPAKVIEVVEVGKQLLITRGSLTTFSIANDVAKYFAILPAVFLPFYASQMRAGPLEVLNIMQLSTPESAILSAVIFNALIIIALVPLALKGVKFTPGLGASKLLQRNLLVYGLGGLLVPFAGIKLIDLLVSAFGLV